jgi:hypothetical protein
VTDRRRRRSVRRTSRKRRRKHSVRARRSRRLGRKAPGEAESSKRWLLGAAQRAAEAAKEGGFLGIGAVRVSEAERTALAEVAQALGVKA